jgi:ATP-dependent Clp protease ATP-binding subunit ClpA
MYEHLTDRARKVLQLANQEALRFNHEYIGTEHILLGLVEEGSGVAANVLKNLNVAPRRVRQEVEKIVLSGPEMVPMGPGKGKLPQTPRAKKIIEYAIEEARNLNHNYVGTEHLLLGTVREGEGVAAQVLMNLGLRLEDVRKEVLNLLGHTSDMAEAETDQGDEPAATFPPSPAVAKALQTVFEFLQEKKEAAIRKHDFEGAARLRDLVEELKKEINYAALVEPGKTVKWLKECDIYIPLSYPDGTAVASEKLAHIRQKLSEEFGGFVELPQFVEGSWEVANVTLQGEIVVFRVLLEPAQGDRGFFQRLRKEFKARLGHDNILITFRTVHVL